MPEEYESCLPEIKALGYTINWKSEWKPGIKEHDVLTAYGRFAYAQFVILTLRVSIAHTPYFALQNARNARSFVWIFRQWYQSLFLYDDSKNVIFMDPSSCGTVAG